MLGKIVHQVRAGSYAAWVIVDVLVTSATERKPVKACLYEYDLRA